MLTKPRWRWLKPMQRRFCDLTVMMILSFYCAVTQAEPEFHLVGRATAGLLSNYQLVEVGQTVGSINAKVEISFAEIFLDVGTGAVRGTVRRALKFVSSRCGTIIEDITYTLTGTFSATTKQFSATSIESRHYTIIEPGDALEFCKDSSFPSFNFCGNLDDDKTLSIYSVDGSGACTTFTRLEGRVWSDVPINFCSAGSAAQATSENRVRTNDEQCFDPPSITDVKYPAEWILEKPTNITVSFRNPGKSRSLSVNLHNFQFKMKREANVGKKESGSFSIPVPCVYVNQQYVLSIFLSSTLGGEGNEFSIKFRCVQPKADPPSVGTQPKLSKEVKVKLLKAADAAEGLATLLFFVAMSFDLEEPNPRDPGVILLFQAIGLINLAEKKRKLAADPPDPNYTEIAQPMTPPFTPITSDDPTLKKLVDASNALLLNQAQTIGLEEALLHAMERAQGAYQAHDAFWQFQQLNAAAQFASQLATLLKAQTTLPAGIQKEWKNAGLPNISLTKDDVTRLQNSISTQGFPKEIVDALTQANFDKAAIDQLKQQLLAQPPQALAGTFPARLNDPKLNSAIQAVASGLTQIASKGCKVNIAAELNFVRFDEDVVRPFAFLPDGDKDGHFQLKLARPNSSNLIYLKLETADKNNRPALGRVWDTDLNTDWMLGLQDAKGKKLNALDKKISVSVNKTAIFELFANDSGYFKSGQHFLVTALFKDGCVAQAATAIAPQTSLLKVDDGSYEFGIGFPAGAAKAYFVNRLTPPSYPATLQNIQIHFANRADGLKQNDAITLLVGKNTSGGTNINSVSFQQIGAKVKSLGEFNQYDMPALTIYSGDFVVGFFTKNPVNIFPMDEDMTAPSRQRSYITADGVNFPLVDSYPNLAGNFAIRATVLLGNTSASPTNDALAQSSPAIQLEYKNDQLTLKVTGLDITSMQLQLYDLSGTKLVNQTVKSNMLVIPALTNRYAPLANGVYLYVITVQTIAGDVIHTKLQKLAIVKTQTFTK